MYGWTTRAVSKPEGVRFLRTTDISRGPVVDWSTVPACDEEPDDVGKYALASGDLVISRAGSVGLSALIEHCPPAVFASYLIRFRPLQGVETRFLKWYLQSTDYWEQIGEAAAGIALQNVNAKKLAAVRLPLAPLAEQRRVVAVLEEHLSDLDAAVAMLERVRANASRYLAAVVEYRVAGVASARAEASLKSLVRVLDQGWSPKCESVSASAGEWAVIKTTAIQPLRFQPEANKRLPVAMRARPALALRAGDLLVTRAGPRSRVGVSCVVPDDQPRLMNCDKVYRVQLRPDRVRPEYVAIVLNAPSYLRRLNEMKSGISDSGVNLTQDRFLDLVVPLPSLDEQESLVRDVALKQSVISHTLDDIDVQLARAARLRQSILQRAFTGRLVPQDPTDEPASALLDRLRAERAAPAGARVNRRIARTT
ncbi:restriction endonuclease subunit S [Gemmatimonadetes bacterium T265]|nr:restriction endonuclease subunit S [Gemmatimonadetes bacterium T265]